MEARVFKCSQCDYSSLNEYDLNTHKKSHIVKSLKCKECEYTSITNADLASHIDTQHVNKFPCDQCEEIYMKELDLNTHKNSKHVKPKLNQCVEIENASFYCQVCGKCYEEFDLFVKHSVKEHGLAPGVKCNTCGKGFVDNNAIEKHIEEEHGINDACSKEKNQDNLKCTRCSKIIRTKIGEQRHKELFCEECGKCSAEKVSFDLHNAINHEQTNVYTCEQCEKTYEGISNLQNHHCDPRQPQNIHCERCPFISKSLDDIITHMKEQHRGREKCEFCDYIAETREDMTDHIYTKHEDLGILNMLGQQQKYCTESFDMFKDEMSVVIKSLSQVVLELRKGQNIMKQELFILRQNQILEEKMIDIMSLPKQHPMTTDTSVGPKVPQPNATSKRKTHQIAPHSPRMLSAPKQSSSPRPSSSPAPPMASRPCAAQSRTAVPNYKEKTLYVGDSISSNINFDTLENGIKTKVIAVKAYSSSYDIKTNEVKVPARYPERNFTDVIASNLENEHFDNLIVQAGSVDITNLNTKVDPTKYFDYFEQEAMMSATNLFSACERAAEQHRSLKNIIIMKQTPRYDPATVDPHSIKPVLSDIYNNRLIELWMASKHKNAIFVGNHNIACTGSIRESRYRVTKTGFFDGIHLCGSSGMKAYTNSVLNILKLAGMINNENDHSNCPQSRYFSQKSGFLKNPNWERDIDTRKTGCGRRLYSEIVNTRYQVPTKNRFSGLKEDQGNY